MNNLSDGHLSISSSESSPESETTTADCEFSDQKLSDS